MNTSTVELRDAANNIVPATVTYNSTTKVATLTPTAALSGSTVYTVNIKAALSIRRQGSGRQSTRGHPHVVVHNGGRRCHAAYRHGHLRPRTQQPRFRPRRQ